MAESIGPAVGLDLMGGDKAPHANVEACVAALKKGVRIVAYGTSEAVAMLSSKGAFDNLTTRICEEVIAPDEHPLEAIRTKQGSSIRRGIEDVKSGSIGAFVSAGSTGALVAGGVLILGRAPGVDKPALATVMPTKTGKGVLFLDLGASADARPQTLVQFAVMGDAYARWVLGWKDPSVYLLNIGTEPEKGSLDARRAYSLLEKAPVNFRGNIEARDVFTGAADIVVTDGFTGNIFLKTCEGTAEFQLEVIRREITSDLLRKVAALVLRPAFRRVREVLDYSAYGGAPLLGLSGCIVKCHGSSGVEAIENGVEQAKKYLENDVSSVIRNTLSKTELEGERR